MVTEDGNTGSWAKWETSARNYVVQWSWEHNVIVGESPEDDGDMAIVQDWETIESKLWPLFCALMDIGKDDYGFADEYTTCSDCGNIIRTSPDGWGWKPDYWLSDCDIICSECLADCEDDYIDWMIEHNRMSRRSVSSVIKSDRLVQHGFTILLQGLENGFHEHQTDDPGAILTYLQAQKLDVAFVASPSQFDVSFDVYVRSTDIDDPRLSQSCLNAIRSAMVKSTYESPYGNTDYLKHEFSDLQTAEMAKAMLRRASQELVK